MRLDRVGQHVTRIHIACVDIARERHILGNRHRNRGHNHPGNRKAWCMLGWCQRHGDFLFGRRSHHVVGQHHEAIVTERIECGLIAVRSAHRIERNNTFSALALHKIRHRIARIDVGRFDRTPEGHVLQASDFDLCARKRRCIVGRS